MMTLLGRGDTGTVAIFSGADDAPFSNPLANLHRIKLHSLLDYRKVLYEVQVSLSLPARTSPGVYTVSHNLFAHGRPGMPWVIAAMTVNGVAVAAGTVPAQRAGTGSPNPWHRLISIGADGANVMAFEYTNVRSAASFQPNYNFSAISIPITVWVTDELF